MLTKLLAAFPLQRGLRKTHLLQLKTGNGKTYILEKVKMECFDWTKEETESFLQVIKVKNMTSLDSRQMELQLTHVTLFSRNNWKSMCADILNNSNISFTVMVCWCKFATKKMASALTFSRGFHE